MNVDEFIQNFNSIKDVSELEKLVEVGKDLVRNAEGHDRGRVLGTLGNIYYALQKFEESEEAYLEALNVYIKLAEENGKYIPYVVGCLYNLGNLYQVLRKYGDAERAYTDALKLADYDTKQKIAILTALGTMYAKLDIRNAAEKYLMEAFNLAKTSGDRRQIGMVLNNLAVVLLRSGRKGEAGMLLKMALDAIEECEDDNSIAAVLQNLLPFLNDTESDKVVKKLEKFKNLPPDLRAKIAYFKAKKAERLENIEQASRLYMDAGCLAFLAYRNFGHQSVNFMHCFDKVIELGGELADDAKTIKELILRYYYGNQKVEPSFESKAGRIIKSLIHGKEIEACSVFENVLRIIATDLINSATKTKN